MSSLYFNEKIESAEIGSTVTLVGEEAKHAVTVARARVGETIAIGNGRGLIAHGTVASLTPFEITVVRVEDAAAASPAFHLVQALAKGDRDELAIQTATELGVSRVTPWAAERSVTRWDGPKIEKGRARWEAIVREASKQSMRSWVPTVGPLATTASRTAIDGQILVLDPLAEVALTSVDLTSIQLTIGGQITVVVGPEGGISERELSTLVGAGAERVRLGSEILRTSSAGPAALSVLNVRLGRW
jgi:16S rRNA (uracil1498-N3)-methyltransferase